ncbi:hypothetical protein EPUL_005653 [Erysiphe pulchra]|uniref:Uncharacterized protein n=1 Tax=Erysiphe pulchra TaxID=225359 RepID=A0A2S4PR71_9PEZI|nr:hypothetical protein EPUL_005653 [Erysiphe pulchra]
MSSSGLSNADGEIIAQGSNNDRALEMKRLFGISGALVQLRSKEIVVPVIGFDAIKENNESPPPNIDRQPPVLNDDDEAEDEDNYGDDKDPGVSWDKNLRPKELRLATFLEGVSNRLDYKEDLLISIQSIGYEPGMRLAPLDEIKLAGAICRTTTSDARTLIRGMKQGTKIMKLFEATF